MDRLLSVLLLAGLGCFVFAFLLSGLYPYLITDAKEPMATLEEVAADVTLEFKALKDSYPVAFAEFPRADEALTDRELIGVPADDPRRTASDEAWREAHAYALRLGRDLYVGEACWHCHSQYVRPAANEETRYGPVRLPSEENNALQRPQLWGTRRVGPDLTYEGGRRSNDWHIAHLKDPTSTSPGSIMPRYPWYFRDGFQVYRGIDPASADRYALDATRAYPYPGVYDTQAEAEKALERVIAQTPAVLADEKERLAIAPGTGPNNNGLAVVSYLQWLGTWTGRKAEEAQ